MKVFKYQIPVEASFSVEMPEEAQILCVQLQNDEPCIWAVVDPAKPIVRRLFYIRGTGHRIAEAAEAEYVGTFQYEGGTLVFHLFAG